MENLYTIGTTNRYALLLDDDADPWEVLQINEQKKEVKKKSKSVEKRKETSNTIPKDEKPVTTETVNDTPSVEIESQNIEQYVDGNDNQVIDQNKNIDENPEDWNDYNEEIIEKVDENNQIDANWGDVTDNNFNNSPQEIVPEGGDVQIVEQPVQQLTLDEWRAQKPNRQRPQYNLRKAGEGVDLTQWSEMFELNKKKDNNQGEYDHEFEVLDYPQRAGRKKHVLDIGFYFNDARRGGGRGRGRGPNGSKGSRRGRPRSEREARDRSQEGFGADENFLQNKTDNTLSVDDTFIFPSLI